MLVSVLEAHALPQLKNFISMLVLSLISFNWFKEKIVATKKVRVVEDKSMEVLNLMHGLTI